MRAALLHLPELDGGVVHLVAGWDGGPTATTSFVLSGRGLQVGPVPQRLPASPEFEPEDPLTPRAWRRDEVVPLRISGLAPPVTLFAEHEAPDAATLALPVTERCDAGDCWVADLPLASVGFRAFRGVVRIWATGLDGGSSLRPTAIPVTRWQFRRMVAGTATPRQVLPARTWSGFIVVGTEDTTTTGRLRFLSPEGADVTPPDFSTWTAAVTAFTTHVSLVVGRWDQDGGSMYFSRGPGSVLPAPVLIPIQGRVLDMGISNETHYSLLEGGNLLHQFIWEYGPPGVELLRAGCSADAGYDRLAVGLGRFSRHNGACFGGPRPDLPHLRNVFALGILGAFVAASDGGLIDTSSSPPLIWDGGVVDGIVTSFDQLWWVTRDQHVWTSDQFSVAPVRLAAELSAPLATHLLLVPQTRLLTSHSGFPGELRGAILAGTTDMAIQSIDLGSGEVGWRLPADAGGGRGGAFGPGLTSAHRCYGMGRDLILVPSTGDGSLYAFIGDHRTSDYRLSRGGWFSIGGDSTGYQRGSILGPECIF